MTEISLNKIRESAHTAGLSLFGVTRATPFVVDSERLKEWQEAGYAGEMSYMNRDSNLLSDPTRLLPGAKWIIQFAVNYGSEKRGDIARGHGKVARYAWGLDYHQVLKSRLVNLINEWRNSLGDFTVRSFSDAVPLLERAIGVSAGLGFVGKNTLLIRPGSGSFFFLAEIITDLDVTGVHEVKSPAISGGSCGSCSQCIQACPTEAFAKPYQLDARRCISYLTIEKRGPFLESEAAMIGDWIFGCDICQEVCPFNYTSLKVSRKAILPEFFSEMGVGSALSLDLVLRIKSEQEFKKLFKNTPLERAKRIGLIRNGAAVAGNTGWEEGVEALLQLAVSDDSDEVRLAAVMALRRIVAKAGNRKLEQIKLALGPSYPDQSVVVKSEIDRVLN
jgi:epoxyqueuosine reductase